MSEANSPVDVLRARDASVGGFIKPRQLEDYAGRYAEHFVLTRTAGVLEIRTHANGQPAPFSRGLLNGWGQVLHDVGADPANEVVIISGTGDRWLDGVSPASFAEPMHDWHRDLVWEQFRDGVTLLERLVVDIDVPTIGILNGPGPRQELPLMCDITLCADTVTIADGNFQAGSVPGDGMFLALSELLGPKRAAWCVYTGQGIPAAEAQQLGLVNEVAATSDLLPRAHELAQVMRGQPRHSRGPTHRLVARQWQQRVIAELRGQYAQQLLAGR
jgi:enoyl-CoA hydratase/carnithine racemase